jgi:glycosyltransferase involved in cell wall biosynthesis
VTLRIRVCGSWRKEYDFAGEGKPMSDAHAMGKPVVLVPHYGPVERECDDGLRQLERHGVKVRRGTFPAIDLLRNVMLSQALHDGFDRFLFIDSDIGFHPEDALRLLASAEPVIAAIYMKKGKKDFSGVFAKGTTKVVFGPGAPGLYPMLYASGGFLRIRGDVLDRMIKELSLPECHFGAIKRIYPFFLPLTVPDGRGGTRYLTEDYSFSHRLRQIGVTPMADTSIKLTHYGKYGFSYEDLNPKQTFTNYTLDITYAEGEDQP